MPLCGLPAGPLSLNLRGLVLWPKGWRRGGGAGTRRWALAIRGAGFCSASGRGPPQARETCSKFKWFVCFSFASFFLVFVALRCAPRTAVHSPCSFVNSSFV